MALQAPVPVPAGLRKRFYEPVILLYCLRYAYRKGSSTDTLEAESAIERNSEETYRCFVNKLGQICDSTRGDNGNTVTSCVVLQPGIIEYRLASNNRTGEDWAAVRVYLTGVLTLLSEASDETIRVANADSEIFAVILRRIIAFMRPRMGWYAQEIKKNVRPCIEEVEGTDTDEAREAVKNLKVLVPLVEFATQRDSLNETEFTTKVEGLLQALNKSYRNSLESFMRAKASGNREGPAVTHWSTMHHAVGRMLSLFVAVKVLISARKFWPEAFVDFEVTNVASSVPDDEPPAIRRTALGIIKRMTGNQSMIQAYERNAENFKEWKLDEKIKATVKPRNFVPIVHSEVLLHNSIVREDRDSALTREEPVRFFRENEFGRYIGSSKPTCRLCEQYFAQCPEVQVRPSHHNFYCKWRLPDVFSGDGELIERRNKIMEQILSTTRQEAFAALQRGSVVWNPFDSNNTASNPLATTERLSSAAAVHGFDDVVSRISSMSLTPRADTEDSSREATPELERVADLLSHLSAQIAGLATVPR